MENTASELSRPFAVAHLGNAQVQEGLSTSASERAALAERFDLLSLDALTAELRLRRSTSGHLILVEGRFEADVVQRCVVTLAPVPVHLAQDFKLAFTMHPMDDGDEVTIDPEAEVEPEPMSGGVIDLGEIVAQQLAVTLEPYPRAPGANLDQAEWGAAEGGDEDDAVHPFAVLRGMKREP